MGNLRWTHFLGKQGSRSFLTFSSGDCSIGVMRHNFIWHKKLWLSSCSARHNNCCFIHRAKGRRTRTSWWPRYYSAQELLRESGNHQWKKFRVILVWWILKVRFDERYKLFCSCKALKRVFQLQNLFPGKEALIYSVLFSYVPLLFLKLVQK